MDPDSALTSAEVHAAVRSAHYLADPDGALATDIASGVRLRLGQDGWELVELIDLSPPEASASPD